MLRGSLSAVLVLALTGCFSVHHHYEGPKLLTSDEQVDGYRVQLVEHFEAHDRQFFWLHGGYPVGESLNAAALAAERAGEHDAVVNLRIADGQDFTDMAITHVACLLSLLCGTWSVWAEGDVADLEPVQ